MEADKEKETKQRKRRKSKNGYKKNYSKGYRGEIITLLLIHGILPYGCFRLLEKDTRMYQRTIKKLEEEEIVKTEKNSACKYISLRFNNFEKQEDYKSYSKEYTEHYLQTAIQSSYMMGRTQTNKTDRADREVKAAYTSIMMYASGIDISPSKKNLQHNFLEPSDCIYYNSKELKQISNYSDKKEKNTHNLQNSRIMGLLYSPGGIYSIYNIGENLIEWKRFGESRMQIYLQNIITRKSLHVPGKHQLKKEAIIIANKPQLYVSICTNEYKNAKERKKIMMNIDYAYDSMYCVPQNKEGVNLLKIISYKNWKEKLKNILLSYDEINDAVYSQINCDGYDKDTDTYKLIFCIPDLVKLKQFLGRAKLEEKREHFEIYCFESQLAIVVPLAKPFATIYSIKQEEVERHFFMEKNYEETKCTY